MNKRIGIGLLIILALGAGFALGLWRDSGPAEPAAVEDRAAAKKEPLYWVAPMDPNYRRDKPGKSPMGMDLIPVYEESGASEGAITIDAAMENSLGVRTEPARVRPLWRRVEATAYVGYDETLISHISVRTQGWITRLLINADGERVRKDDLLFELYSPELVNAQKEYLQARKRNDSRLISGGEEKLRALGMIRSEVEALARTGNMSESVRVVAPQDGVISALNVREGMFVEPNSTIMSLADLSSVWLQAEVFESQAEWVAAGQAAKASLDYLPGQEFNGQVDYVYPILDSKTRTLRVRLRFENPEERLKPNMYARVSIYGKLHPNALSIPREALIRGKGMSRVVLSLGDGRFRVHEVLTGMESGEFVEIIAGIEAGDEVVTSAQFLLDSEASLAGGIKRLEAVPKQEERERFELVLASGRVEAVDPVRRRIRVSHGPIDALAWPGMIMEFEVLSEVELDALRAGQNVRFALQQQHAGEYAIARLSTEDDESELTVQTPSDEQADTRAGAREAEAAEEEGIRAEGMAVIVGIDRPARRLELEHGPIEALGWPAMTMAFDVSEGVNLEGLESGQRIRFTLGRPDGQAYVVEHIEAEETGAEHGAHDHD